MAKTWRRADREDGIYRTTLAGKPTTGCPPAQIIVPGGSESGLFSRVALKCAAADYAAKK